MTNSVRRVLAMSLATALMLAVVLLITASAGATAAEDQTCSDVGFQNLTGSVSGPWGSVTFSDTETELTLVVEAGYEVRLCVKAGSAVQGDGPEVSDWLDEGTYTMDHSSGKELSHYGILYRQVITTTTASDEEPTTTASDEEPTTTTVVDETTTTAGETTTTADGQTTTTAAETTTTGGSATTAPAGPSTTHNTPSPEDTLPFTGIEDWLAPLAGGLALVGLVGLSLAGRMEDAIDE